MKHKFRRKGMGPKGFCCCPKCGFKKPYITGIPSRDENCPKCGYALIRG